MVVLQSEGGVSKRWRLELAVCCFDPPMAMHCVHMKSYEWLRYDKVDFKLEYIHTALNTVSGELKQAVSVEQVVLI